MTLMSSVPSRRHERLLDLDFQQDSLYSQDLPQLWSQQGHGLDFQDLIPAGAIGARNYLLN